jgi:ATP-dependent DNA helicase RecG
LTENEVLQLLDQGEGPAVAFLPARFRPQALGETLVALANGHGGHVLVGVRTLRRTSIEGLPAPEEVRALVLEVAQDCTPALPLPPPEVVAVGGSAVLVVTVPAGLPMAYHWRGLYLQRVGGKNALLSGTELRSLLLERSEEGFEQLIPAGATLDDLDMARVGAFAARQPAAPADRLALLAEYHCIAGPPGEQCPTYAGLLLFGRNPQAFLPQARIVLARYPGTTPGQPSLRREASGPLPDQVLQAEAFLQTHMRRGRMWLNEERVEVTEYPLEAVREAIVNAVAHRDYSVRGDDIRVSMFQDRIEVYSPGRLLGPVTVGNIREERFLRNPVIAQVLTDMGMAGRLGDGVDRMMVLMEDAHLPPPAFAETRAGFVLTLHGPSGMAVGELPADPQALARLGLNERQVRALLYVGEKGQIAGRELQDLCPEVSGETLRRDLTDLVSRGLLLKVGERRTTYYILK